MLDYNTLEELMNRTFSDTDDTDSTFVVSKIEEDSTSGSSDEASHSADYRSPSKSENNAQSSTYLQETLPIASTSETNVSSKSAEITFESTVADTEGFVMTEEGSTSSLNEESRTKFESNGKLSIGSTEESEHFDPSASSKSDPELNKKEKVGKESLNQFSDPADALMAKLVEKCGTVNQRAYGKYHQGNKKYNNKIQHDGKPIGQENINNGNHQEPMESKSQESIDKK